MKVYIIMRSNEEYTSPPKVFKYQEDAKTYFLEQVKQTTDESFTEDELLDFWCRGYFNSTEEDLTTVNDTRIITCILGDLIE